MNRQLPRLASLQRLQRLALQLMFRTILQRLALKLTFWGFQNGMTLQDQIIGSKVRYFLKIGFEIVKIGWNRLKSMWMWYYNERIAHIYIGNIEDRQKSATFSSECNLRCVSNWPFWKKALWHWLQGYSFSSECNLRCVFKWPFWEKALGHWLQGVLHAKNVIENSFSVICFDTIPVVNKNSHVGYFIPFAVTSAITNLYWIFLDKLMQKAFT